MNHKYKPGDIVKNKDRLYLVLSTSNINMYTIYEITESGLWDATKTTWHFILERDGELYTDILSEPYTKL